MKEVQPAAHATPLSAFDETSITRDGYVEVPLGARMRQNDRIKHLEVDAWGFVGSGSVPIDEASNRMAIDTNDKRVPKPTNLAEFINRPVVMRVVQQIGERAVAGFVVDCRRVTHFVYDEMGLDEGVASTAFLERQAEYGTELPLGVVFDDDEKVLYVGHAEAEPNALYLAQQVDQWVTQQFTEPALVQPRRALVDDNSPIDN